MDGIGEPSACDISTSEGVGDHLARDPLTIGVVLIARDIDDGVAFHPRDLRSAGTASQEDQQSEKSGRRAPGRL